jgi:hypothetical protein
MSFPPDKKGHRKHAIATLIMVNYYVCCDSPFHIPSVVHIVYTIIHENSVQYSHLHLNPKPLTMHVLILSFLVVVNMSLECSWHCGSKEHKKTSNKT